MSTERYVIYWKKKEGGSTHHSQPIEWDSLKELDNRIEELNKKYPQLVHWALPCTPSNG